MPNSNGHTPINLDQLTQDLNNALPDSPVSSLDAMTALVRADGDLDLAAVRLKTKKANILAAIITDPNNHDTLARYLRAHQSLRLFSLIEHVTSALEPHVDDMAPKDLARSLTGLLEVFTKFTEKPEATNTNGTNHVEDTLKLFPPHIQQAIRTLAAPSAKQQEVESTSSTSLAGSSTSVLPATPQDNLPDLTHPHDNSTENKLG